MPEEVEEPKAGGVEEEQEQEEEEEEEEQEDKPQQEDEPTEEPTEEEPAEDEPQAGDDEEALVALVSKLQTRVRDLKTSHKEFREANRGLSKEIRELERRTQGFSSQLSASGAAASGRVFVSGWLVHQSRGLLGLSVKSRFGVLYDRQLELYASAATTHKPLVSLSLKDARVSVVALHKGAKLECLQVSATNAKGKPQSVFICVDEEAPAGMSNSLWRRAIRNRIELIKYEEACEKEGVSPDGRLLQYLADHWRYGDASRELKLHDQALSKSSFAFVLKWFSKAGTNDSDDHDGVFPCCPPTSIEFVNASLNSTHVKRLSDALVAFGARTRVEADEATRLRVVDLSNNKVGPALGAESVAAVLNCPGVAEHLRELRLEFAFLGDAGLKVLTKALAEAEHEALEVLCLAHNDLTCDSVGPFTAHLADKGLPRLRVLDLSQNVIAADGGAGVAAAIESGRLPALKTLDLHDNRLDDAAAERLAEALAKQRADDAQQTALHTLDLHSNQIGDAGAKALAHMAQKNGTLHELHFLNHRLGEDALTALRLLCAHRLPVPSEDAI